jgi:hypothetical protein
MTLTPSQLKTLRTTGRLTLWERMPDNWQPVQHNFGSIRMADGALFGAGYALAWMTPTVREGYTAVGVEHCVTSDGAAAYLNVPHKTGEMMAVYYLVEPGTLQHDSVRVASCVPKQIDAREWGWETVVAKGDQ